MAKLTHAGGAPAARRRGFSLIEVMIAVTILGIGLLALAGAQMQAMRGGQAGRHGSTASAIAQTQMEQLQRSRWTAIPAANWTPLIVINQMVDDGNGLQAEQAYNLSWRIADVVVGQTRALDVRVTWNEQNRPNRSVTYSSIRFNREGL